MAAGLSKARARVRVRIRVRIRVRVRVRVNARVRVRVRAKGLDRLGCCINSLQNEDPQRWHRWHSG